MRSRKLKKQIEAFSQVKWERIQFALSLCQILMNYSYYLNSVHKRTQNQTLCLIQSNILSVFMFISIF